MSIAEFKELMHWEYSDRWYLPDYNYKEGKEVPDFYEWLDSVVDRAKLI